MSAVLARKYDDDDHQTPAPPSPPPPPLQILNANPDLVERESEIVGQAGRLGVVTVATNMAGRGTDILLGGNPSVMARIRVRDALAEELLGEEDLAGVPKVRREEERKVRARAQERGREHVGVLLCACTVLDVLISCFFVSVWNIISVNCWTAVCMLYTLLYCLCRIYS